MHDETRSCQRTLHISLFFDGTNNNDAKSNRRRDSLKRCHTNVARLFNAAIDRHEEGLFAYYIPGVGTPLPEIGEKTYLQLGKAMAKGFNARCLWGYANLLNAVYYAIAPDKSVGLISLDKAKRLCDAGANGDMSGFADAIQALGVTHKDNVDNGDKPRTIRKIWINVIGFSRGAAGARAFVHKLVNEWAPGGNLVKFGGQYALTYQVNFMGLFDTVASVGPPDSTRATVDIGSFDGHFAFASDGAMRIPDAVRYCVHAFSIHEQRMSFPVDSIRDVGGYPGGVRLEIAYPGVHSDVGGGYAPNEQGKGRDSGTGDDDSGKLSQIPLHDMYIHALRYGVPLMSGPQILAQADIASDFALAPNTITAFNDWLKTAGPIGSIEDAIKHGMSEMLAWRTLRAKIGTPDYVTQQEFFRLAHEDGMTPHKVYKSMDKATKADPELHLLNEKLSKLQGEKSGLSNNQNYPANMGRIRELEDQIGATREAIDRRTEAVCGAVAHPGTANPSPARPGEGSCDVTTNDQNDLRQGAEEMRLLLGYLHPDQRDVPWKVTAHVSPNSVPRDAFPDAPRTVTILSVAHDQPGSDSPKVTLAESGVLLATTWGTILSQFSPVDDLVAAPTRGVVGFLKKHASLEAAAQLRPEIIRLLDNYVHDSRIWFRVPWFHEYAPGGYGWPRVIFVGGTKRIAYLGLTSESEPLTVGSIRQAAWA
ncbi:DUF2235 domain-containing protein [Paraburkholderia sp. LEh10]|uniref:T6SS phospholipase effector Tle1-like catalytic domain-containing protein n=1 Tax=Paraburkholderia sp. LEh10 TaxID=2821353 RepID=UPI0028ABDFA9|nr:DUF2235 domain-containing protein [Paraburkholderia sp. LEh10]